MPTRNPLAERRANTLSTHVGEFSDFSAALITLAEMLPERVTVSQACFFLLAALADMAGKPATFTEIRDTAGDAISRSMHTTYKAFIDGSRGRDRGRGLGWLRREEDPQDNRQKFLRLTALGREVMRELLLALTGECPDG